MTAPEAGRRRRAVGIIAPVLAVGLLFSGCAPVAEDVLAATDVFDVTAADLERWRPFLNSRRETRDRVREAADPDRELVRLIALIRLVNHDYADLVPERQRRAVDTELHYRAIRSAYLRRELTPRVVVDETEARQIFEDHHDNYQKAEGVRVLEIFLWAPTDLPELRAERRKHLDRLMPSLGDRQAFEEAARTHSQATSAYRGGRLGTITRDMVGGALEEALFGNGTGLTDVVASVHGVHLFWIIDRVPARTNTFEDVAEGITAKLHSLRLEELVAEDAARLKTKYGMAVIPAAESDDGHALLRIGGEHYRASDLDLPIDPDRMSVEVLLERRGIAMLYERELEPGRVQPEDENELEREWAVYQTAWRYAVADELARSSADFFPQTNDPRSTPRIERLSFDLLRVAVERRDSVFDVHRALHRIPSSSGLEPIRRTLAEDQHLEARIEIFHEITAGEMTRLGPEVHTTVMRRLDPGERSQPLFLEDRNQVVVVLVKDRMVDEAASEAAAERWARRRHRAAESKRMEQDLLHRHRFAFF